MEENQTTEDNRTLGNDLAERYPNIVWQYHLPLLVLGFLGLLFGILNIFKHGIFHKQTITMLFNGAIYASIGSFPLYYKKDNYKLVDSIVNLGAATMYIGAFISGLSTNGYFIGFLFAPAFVIYGICTLGLYFKER